MAVNGIEIEVGQEWITYAGSTVVIEHLLDGGKFLAVDPSGSTRVYDINGRSDATGGYLASDLERLTTDLPVSFAETAEPLADADQLASETLGALGWTFDGQCWSQPSEWPTGKQSALDIQHGGNHYKGFAIQPVEFIHANGVPFIEGNCIKYLMRWREKGGVKDLDKVKHYVDLLIELEAKHTKVF